MDEVQRAEGRAGVFISYNTTNAVQVEEIASRLEAQHGIPVWYDRKIEAGAKWPDAIALAISGARACLVMIGEHGLHGYDREEVKFILDFKMKEADLRVIPVLLPGARADDLAAAGARCGQSIFFNVNNPASGSCGVSGMSSGRRGCRGPQCPRPVSALTRSGT